VEEVSATINYLGMDAGHLAARFRAVLRAILCASEMPLRLRQPLLILGEEAGIIHLLTVIKDHHLM
jgi:hypothetical protein